MPHRGPTTPIPTYAFQHARAEPNEPFGSSGDGNGGSHANHARFWSFRRCRSQSLADSCSTAVFQRCGSATRHLECQGDPVGRPRNVLAACNRGRPPVDDSLIVAHERHVVGRQIRPSTSGGDCDHNFETSPVNPVSTAPSGSPLSPPWTPLAGPRLTNRG
jgi:hypothetical protein